MITEVREKNEWMHLLQVIGNYDCYHTFDYHQISKLANHDPVLLVYKADTTIILIPLIIRPIVNTIFFDATSVYGYCGPLSNKKINDIEIKAFNHYISAFLKSKNIISVFSRLNPFIKDQTKILKKIGKIENLGKVVNIDLTLDIETQKQFFSKTTKRYLNKTRDLCNVKKSKKVKDILLFMDLYYENMNRVKAKKHYYFEMNYFLQMVRATDFETEVYFAELKKTGEIISAAMIMKTKNIIQYHISGTKDKHLKITPIRLLLDEIRIDGTIGKYTFFNLGGGLGSEEDSLFNFKASFSKDYKPFQVWKYVVDQDIYNKLSEGITSDSDFFPLYRSTF